MLYLRQLVPDLISSKKLLKDKEEESGSSELTSISGKTNTIENRLSMTFVNICSGLILNVQILSYHGWT